MEKTAVDLGIKNIPRPLLELISPQVIKTLYWREASTSQKDITFEIWSTENNEFIVFAGDFSIGSWDSQMIKVVGEFKTLDKAMNTALSHYVAASRLKRLIKK